MRPMDLVISPDNPNYVVIGDLVRFNDELDVHIDPDNEWMLFVEYKSGREAYFDGERIAREADGTIYIGCENSEKYNLYLKSNPVIAKYLEGNMSFEDVAKDIAVFEIKCRQQGLFKEKTAIEPERDDYEEIIQ